MGLTERVKLVEPEVLSELPTYESKSRVIWNPWKRCALSRLMSITRNANLFIQTKWKNAPLRGKPRGPHCPPYKFMLRTGYTQTLRRRRGCAAYPSPLGRSLDTCVTVLSICLLGHEPRSGSESMAIADPVFSFLLDFLRALFLGASSVVTGRLKRHCVMSSDVIYNVFARHREKERGLFALCPCLFKVLANHVLTCTAMAHTIYKIGFYGMYTHYLCRVCINRSI